MADNQEERQKRDEQIRETIMAKLIETGEKVYIYIHKNSRKVSFNSHIYLLIFRIN